MNRGGIFSDAKWRILIIFDDFVLEIGKIPKFVNKCESEINFLIANYILPQVYTIQIVFFFQKYVDILTFKNFLIGCQKKKEEVSLK